MKMNMTFEQIYNQMAWTRKPEKVEAKGGVIAVTTKPHTDLWQRTYYHLQMRYVLVSTPARRRSHRSRLFSRT